MHIAPVFGCSYFPWWNVKTHLPFFVCVCFSSSSPFFDGVLICDYYYLLLPRAAHRGSANVCYLIFQSHEGQPQHSNHNTLLFIWFVQFFFLFFVVVHLLICEHLQTWERKSWNIEFRSVANRRDTDVDRDRRRRGRQSRIRSKFHVFYLAYTRECERLLEQQYEL